MMDLTLPVADGAPSDRAQLASIASEAIDWHFARIEHHLGIDPRRYLAVPQVTARGISWITLGLRAAPVSDLSRTVAVGLAEDVDEWLMRLHTLRVRLGRTTSPEDIALAAWLKSIATSSADGTLYLVDNRPVLAGWYKSEPEPQVTVPPPNGATATPGSASGSGPTMLPSLQVGQVIPGSPLAAGFFAAASVGLVIWIIVLLVSACSFGLTVSRWGIPGVDLINKCVASASDQTDPPQARIAELETEIAETLAACPAPVGPFDPSSPPVPEPNPELEPEPMDVLLRVKSSNNARAGLCIYALCKPYVNFAQRDSEQCQSDLPWLEPRATDTPHGICRLMVMPVRVKAPGGQEFSVEIEYLLNDELKKSWNFSDRMVDPTLQQQLIEMNTPHLYYVGDFPHWRFDTSEE